MIKNDILPEQINDPAQVREQHGLGSVRRTPERCRGEAEQARSGAELPNGNAFAAEVALPEPGGEALPRTRQREVARADNGGVPHRGAGERRIGPLVALAKPLRLAGDGGLSDADGRTAGAHLWGGQSEGGRTGCVTVGTQRAKMFAAVKLLRQQNTGLCGSQAAVPRAHNHSGTCPNMTTKICAS